MNKFEKEANVVLSMKELTGDDKWSMEDNNIKILTLEHMMAARRLGFEDFLGIMRHESGLRNHLRMAGRGVPVPFFVVVKITYSGQITKNKILIFP